MGLGTRLLIAVGGIFAVFLAVIVLLVILIALPPFRTVTDISSSSPIVGKIYKTQFPLLYLKNIPFYRDVNEFTRSNSVTAWARGISAELISFTPDKSQFLSEESLVTPIRIDLVPKGTVFTVVKKLRYRIWHLWSGGPFYAYLLEDSQGNIAQISGLYLDDYLVKPEIDETTSWKFLEADEGWNPRVIASLRKSDYEGTVYCPDKRWDETPQSVRANIAKFVLDFGLEKEITWQTHRQEQWQHCTSIFFYSVEAYMTMQYYMFQWNLHGKLYTYE